jgi:hypothetical protein
VESTRFFWSDLNEILISRQILEKYANIKFHGSLFSGIRVVACGRTGKHDEANSCFSQFGYRA